MKKSDFIYLFLTLLFFSCDEEICPANSDHFGCYSFEDSTLVDWNIIQDSLDSYEFSWTQEEAYDGLSCIQITSDNTTNVSPGSWEVRFENIPKGRTYRLRARVKALNLEGTGLEVWIKSYDSLTGLFGSGAGNTNNLHKGEEWKDFVLDIDLPSDSRENSIKVLFSIGEETSGTIFIDKVEILDRIIFL